MIRVLHILNELSNGGNCHFIMNYYRHINREKVQFDFLVSTQEKDYFEDEIISLGGKVYHICTKKRLLQNYQETANIVKEHNYQIVHRHTGSAFGYFDLRAAKHGGAKHLILHAHNNLAGNMLLHRMSKIVLKTDCIRLACSKEAGEFLFGNNVDFTIINNAIECSKFSFNEEKRNAIRVTLDVDDKIVIGHVGRFETQKNHCKLLEIFCAFKKEHPNSVLVCVGSGSLMQATKEYARRLGIEDSVLFLGSRNDVSDLMCAFDLFLFPSIYEGFGIVLVEAQTSGLPCVSSDCVPRVIDLTGQVKFIPLEEEPIKWVRVMNDLLAKSPRHDNSQIIKKAGFDLNDNVNKLEDFYLGLSTMNVGEQK